MTLLKKIWHVIVGIFRVIGTILCTIIGFLIPVVKVILKIVFWLFYILLCIAFMPS